LEKITNNLFRFKDERCPIMGIFLKIGKILMSLLSRMKIEVVLR
jgi:hypothetical protein